uniref:Uncharacterized protein n=1 Tax=Oryza brachyantha TaxID=4533 RepID=J3NDV7_ORYBR
MALNKNKWSEYVDRVPLKNISRTFIDPYPTTCETLAPSLSPPRPVDLVVELADGTDGRRQRRTALIMAAAANIAGSMCVGDITVLALVPTVFLRMRLLPALVLVCAVYTTHRYVDFICAVGVVVAMKEPRCDNVVARSDGRRWCLFGVFDA